MIISSLKKKLDSCAIFQRILTLQSVNGYKFRKFVSVSYPVREISVGDYVLTGGELPACVMTDAIVRLIPGAMNDESSALSDSFQDNLLAPPVYTRPAEFNGWRVPDILLSGNHAKIHEWQEQLAYERTRALRPDLLDEL